MIECNILRDLLVKELNYYNITITIPEQNKVRISITKPYHRYTPDITVNRIAYTIINRFKQEGINVTKINPFADFHEYVVDADINLLIGLLKIKGVCS